MADRTGMTDENQDNAEHRRQEGRQRGGERSSGEQDRDETGQFAGKRDENM